MARPFRGIRVVDLSHILAGPYCTFQLALLGAEVIKVERPDGGDFLRTYEFNPELTARGMEACFMAINAGKQSITVNLKTDKGRAIVKRLAGDADVFVENFRSGVIDRLGLGYEVLSELNPKLVYCSLTGFGNTGPLRGTPAYDHIVQGMSGIMYLTGAPGGMPTKVGIPVIDIAAGMMGAYAISAALFHRERTGEGQYIDLSMLDSMLNLMVAQATDYMISGIEPKQVGNVGFSGSPTANTFRTKDRLITTAANTQQQFEAMCRVIGRTDLSDDPRFATLALRKQNRASLCAEIERALEARTAQEWERLLAEANVAAAVVRTLPEVLESPQIEARQLKIDLPVPGIAESVRILNTGFRFRHDGPGVEAPPPTLGQHTDALLQSIGYSADDVSALRDEGVI